jgi:eukaryotic-like serine/threonine-protein kinase
VGDPPKDEAEEATVVRRSSRSSRAPKALDRGSPSAALSPSPAATDGTGSRPNTGSAASTGSAIAEAMLAEEATRAHGFAGVVGPLCVATSLMLPFLGGDPTAKLLCGAALFAMGAASLAVFYLTRDDSDTTRYTRVMHRSYGWVLVIAVLFVEYYCGFFSPVAVVLTLGTYYLGQSSDRSHSFLLPLLVVVSYALLASLTAAGLLADRGLFKGDHAEPSSRLFAVAAASFVLAMTLRMARVSRAALREAIERSNEALLVAQRREAQLAEAHHELDYALRVAVGKPGRYTGALAGEYRLDIVIGVGAIGEVYSAQHTRDGSPAAVKLLQAAALERDDLVERILREGAISRKLDSAHVVRVLDTGRLPDGAPYLAMELLQGRDLAARLRQAGQLEGGDLAVLAQQVGAGLQHAHDAGIVHRDLKPLNIFEAALDGGGHAWKILDFGISKHSSSGGTLTREGVIGTPGYMSPEQAKGATVDHRSDIFAMAVVLYRAMTGQPAFPGESTPQILFDVVYKMPKRPSSIAKNVPSDVDLVMAIALAKYPAERFQSAQEFADAFVQAMQRKLVSVLRERGASMTRTYEWGKTLVVPASGGLDGA